MELLEKLSGFYEQSRDAYHLIDDSMERAQFYMSKIYHWSVDQWMKSTILSWRVIYF